MGQKWVLQIQQKNHWDNEINCQAISEAELWLLITWMERPSQCCQQGDAIKCIQNCCSGSPDGISIELGSGQNDVTILRLCIIRRVRLGP